MPLTADDAALVARTVLGTAITPGVSDGSPAESVAAILSRLETMGHELRADVTGLKATVASGGVSDAQLTVLAGKLADILSQRLAN